MKCIISAWMRWSVGWYCSLPVRIYEELSRALIQQNACACLSIYYRAAWRHRKIQPLWIIIIVIYSPPYSSPSRFPGRCCCTLALRSSQTIRSTQLKYCHKFQYSFSQRQGKQHSSLAWTVNNTTSQARALLKSFSVCLWLEYFFFVFSALESDGENHIIVYISLFGSSDDHGQCNRTPWRFYLNWIQSSTSYDCGKAICWLHSCPNKKKCSII